MSVQYISEFIDWRISYQSYIYIYKIDISINNKPFVWHEDILLQVASQQILKIIFYTIL